MQRTYEVMFIVRPDLSDEDVDKLISTLESQATGVGAVIKSVERMGKRRLAYTVRKFKDGNYVLLLVEGSGDAVHEIERRLRVTEPVIKFITVRTDVEQKRLDKVKKIRDSRRKHSAIAAAAAAAATPEAGTEPAPAGAIAPA
jgi:small subunit ribosomal protein S6